MASQLRVQEANSRPLCDTTKEFEVFFDAIRNGTESPVAGEFGLRFTRLTEAAFGWAEQGVPVDAGTLPADDADSDPA